MDERDLSRALGDLPLAKRGWLCPTDETLAAYADGRIAAEQRRKVEPHLTRCAHCRQQVAALVKLSEQPVEAVPPGLFARGLHAGNWGRKPSPAHAKPWAVGATALAGVILAVAVVPLGRRPADKAQRGNAAALHAPVPPSPLEDPGGPTGVRAFRPAAILPVVVSPREGATLSAREVEIRWDGTADGLSYRVTVLTPEGDVRWQKSTQANPLHVPANVLPPGRYFVSVSANLSDGKTARSTPVGFQIASVQ